MSELVPLKMSGQFVGGLMFDVKAIVDDKWVRPSAGRLEKMAPSDARLADRYGVPKVHEYLVRHDSPNRQERRRLAKAG